MNKLLESFNFNDKDSLICRIEVTSKCITIYGRVKDNSKKWAPEMQKLIEAIEPITTAHMEQDERAQYHPGGSQGKRTGYPYFHHVHSPHNLKETISRINKWLPREARIQ